MDDAKQIDGRKVKILYVDDRTDDHELVSIYFDTFAPDAADLTCVTDGNAALHALKAEQFDLVMLDNRIPPENDFRRSYEKLGGDTFDGPVVVISANINDKTFTAGALPDNVVVLDKADLPEWVKSGRFRPLASPG